MLVDGSQPGSAVTVNANSILGGTGTVGAITAVGGTVAPGDPSSAPGTLTAASANFAAGGTLLLQVTNPGSPVAGVNFDRLNLGTGTLTTGATSALIVDLSGATTSGNVSGLVLNGGYAGTPTTTFTNFSAINNINSLIVSPAYATGSVNLNIASATTTTVVSSSSPTVVYGTSVTFTATVTSAAARRQVPSVHR